MKTKTFYHLAHLVLLTSSCSIKYYQESDFRAVKKIDAHKLPKKVIEKIYYTNAVKWFGIKG